MFNYDLSRRRSEAVKQYLISKGVQSERISTEHFGEMMPIDTNDTPEGRKKNRRVEMKLIFN
jgi:outer membrane protein OmpA-like peptidoglycan-associated protein